MVGRRGDGAVASGAGVRPRTRVRTRQVALRWDDRPLPKHFVGDDLVLSHTAAVLSSMFPEGEAFFVRSVRHYRSKITDPELAAQVTGFIGQESVHAREHRGLNERLAELGYPTRHLERRAGLGLKVVEWALPPSVCLAATAMLEHATATLAEVLLSSPEVQALFADDQMRDLVLWHALEEAEHKAVAFDVYQEVCGKEWLRVWMLRVAVVTTGLDLLSGVVTSMLFDPAARRPRAVWRSLRALRSSPFAGTGMGRRFLDYQRLGFHPDDHDTAVLLDTWAARLSEPGEVLAGR